MFSTVVEQAVHPITGTYKAEYIYRWMVSTVHYCIRYNKLMVDMPTAGNRWYIDGWLVQFSTVYGIMS